jgi:hypothetical protein
MDKSKVFAVADDKEVPNYAIATEQPHAENYQKQSKFTMFYSLGHSIIFRTLNIHLFTKEQC